MKTIKRFIIFIAIIFIIGGSIVLAFAIKNNAFAQKERIDKTYEIDGEFQNISVIINVDDFELKLSTDGKNKLVCQEYDKMPHETSVSDNCLNVLGKDERKWYEKIFVFEWNFKPIKSILYLNKDTFNNIVVDASTGNFVIGNEFTFENADLKLSTGNLEFNAKLTNDLKAKVSTGSVYFKNVDCKNVELKSSTGLISVENMNCEKFKSEGSTGSIKLTNVIAENEMEVVASTGDIYLKEVDSKKIYAKVSTGNIRGVILTPKIFTTTVKTGHANVPSNPSADLANGECILYASTGNIDVSIK